MLKSNSLLAPPATAATDAHARSLILLCPPAQLHTTVPTSSTLPQARICIASRLLGFNPQVNTFALRVSLLSLVLSLHVSPPSGSIRGISCRLRDRDAFGYRTRVSYVKQCGHFWSIVVPLPVIVCIGLADQWGV